MLRQIAEERAGLRLAPTAGQVASLSPAERYWRLWSAVGDEFERSLAAAVGQERARAYRGRGWRTMVIYGSCPEESGAMP